MDTQQEIVLPVKKGIRSHQVVKKLICSQEVDAQRRRDTQLKSGYGVKNWIRIPQVDTQQEIVLAVKKGIRIQKVHTKSRSGYGIKSE